MAVSKLSTNDVRERIVDVSARLFAKKGYHAVSIREIAEAAQVTKPAIYYYFEGKKNLYDSLVVDGFEKVHCYIKEAVGDDADSAQKVLSAIKAHFSFCLENLNTMKLIYLCILESVEHTSLSNQSFKIMEDLIAEAQQGDRFLKGNPKDLSIALMGIINIFLMKQLVVKEKILTEDLAKRILSMIS